MEPQPLRRRPCCGVAVGARSAAPGMPTSTLSLPPVSFSWSATNVIELAARGEPFFAAAEVDVIDREAAGRILPFGVDPEADAAAFEGDDRFFERGERAARGGSFARLR